MSTWAVASYLVGIVINKAISTNPIDKTLIIATQVLTLTMTAD